MAGEVLVDVVLVGPVEGKTGTKGKRGQGKTGTDPSRPTKVLRVRRSVNNCGRENNDLQVIPACRISGKYLLHTNRPQRIGAMTYFPSGATPLSDGLGQTTFSTAHGSVLDSLSPLQGVIRDRLRFPGFRLSPISPEKPSSGSTPGSCCRLGRSLFSLFAAWFPGGATISRPYDSSFPAPRRTELGVLHHPARSLRHPRLDGRRNPSTPGARFLGTPVAYLLGPRAPARRPSEAR